MLTENDIKELIDNRYIQPIKDISFKIKENKQDIDAEFQKSCSSNIKEEMLLHFRRAVEMLIKSDLLLSVTTLSSNNIIAVRKENFLQLLDDRYYSKLQVTCFMDTFRIETNEYKSLFPNGAIVNEPHIGLVISYILNHYTNTFTRFTNRNLEYYYIYEFFYKNGQEIKEVLTYLNSYHYSKEDDWIVLYNTDIEEIRTKIISIYNEVKKILSKI